jgi:hypothetical protein
MSALPDNQHTIFISYSPADEAWVEEQLKPKLKERKVKYGDGFDLRGGLPKLNEIEQMIKKCHRTILVLSPQYLKDSWELYNSGMVLSFGLNSQRWLAVPVVALPCNVPEHLQMLVNIDLSNDDVRAWDQLFEAVFSTDIQIIAEDFVDAKQAAANGSRITISRGLRALCELLANPGVRGEVEKFVAEFEKARIRIQVVADYKDIHDELHSMQKECLQPLSDAVGRFPDEERTRSSVFNSQQDLERILETIREIIARPTFGEGPYRWLVMLEQAYEHLVRANTLDTTNDSITERELRAKALEDSVSKLAFILGVQPTQINVQLAKAASDLRLTDLLDTLSKILIYLVGLEDYKERVTQFALALQSLAELCRQLQALINDHDKWQVIDVYLREMKNNPDIKRLKTGWMLLSEIMEPLYAGRMESWSRVLQKEADALGNAIQADDFDQAKEPFQRLYSIASDRFVRVDKAIKRLCNDLREVGTSLSMMLEIIR